VNQELSQFRGSPYCLQSAFSVFSFHSQSKVAITLTDLFCFREKRISQPSSGPLAAGDSPQYFALRKLLIFLQLAEVQGGRCGSASSNASTEPTVSRNNMEINIKNRLCFIEKFALYIEASVSPIVVVFETSRTWPWANSPYYLRRIQLPGNYV
jgi:hypothetical protein